MVRNQILMSFGKFVLYFSNRRPIETNRKLKIRHLQSRNKNDHSLFDGKKCFQRLQIITLEDLFVNNEDCYCFETIEFVIKANINLIKMLYTTVFPSKKYTFFTRIYEEIILLTFNTIYLVVFVRCRQID